jgi:hypothetical protein
MNQKNKNQLQDNSWSIMRDIKVQNNLGNISHFHYLIKIKKFTALDFIQPFGA